MSLDRIDLKDDAGKQKSVASTEGGDDAADKAPEGGSSTSSQAPENEKTKNSAPELNKKQKIGLAAFVGLVLLLYTFLNSTGDVSPEKQALETEQAVTEVDALMDFEDYPAPSSEFETIPTEIPDPVDEGLEISILLTDVDSNSGEKTTDEQVDLFSFDAGPLSEGETPGAFSFENTSRQEQATSPAAETNSSEAIETFLEESPSKVSPAIDNTSTIPSGLALRVEDLEHEKSKLAKSLKSLERKVSRMAGSNRSGKFKIPPNVSLLATFPASLNCPPCVSHALIKKGRVEMQIGEGDMLDGYLVSISKDRLDLVIPGKQAAYSFWPGVK